MRIDYSSPLGHRLRIRGHHDGEDESHPSSEKYGFEPFSLRQVEYESVGIVIHESSGSKGLDGVVTLRFSTAGPDWQDGGYLDFHKILDDNKAITSSLRFVESSVLLLLLSKR